METLLEIIRDDQGEIKMRSQFYDINLTDLELLRDVEQAFYRSGMEVSAAAELVSLALGLCNSALDLPIEQLPKPRLRITAQMSRNPELFDSLKNWRKSKADEKEMPPFVIFNNKVLLDIADNCPVTEEELLDIKGFGPVMLDRYGADILEITNSF